MLSQQDTVHSYTSTEIPFIL